MRARCEMLGNTGVRITEKGGEKNALWGQFLALAPEDIRWTIFNDLDTRVS